MGAKPPIRFQHYMRRFSRTPAVGQASKITPNNKTILPSSTRPPGLHCLTGVSNSPWVPAPSSYVGPMGLPMFMEECGGGGGGRSPPYGFNNIFEGFPGPPRSAKPQENTPKKEARLPSSIWPPGLNCLTGVSKSPGIPAPSNSHCPRAGLGDERQIATSTLNNHINVVRFWAGLRPKFVPDRFQRTRFRKCYTDQRRLLRETDSKAPGQESEIRP